MATCPKGHESASSDYCDVCGTLIGATVPAPVAAAPATKECPRCHAALEGRFCEQCGKDSLAPVEPDSSTVDELVVREPAPAGELVAVVTADHEYFQFVKASLDGDTGGVVYPAFYPVRRFPLTGAQLVIGRRSKSRGVYPEIDLSGSPEDSAVSHQHAVLLPQPDGGWVVLDLNSTNRTFLNGGSDPIEVETPVPLKVGDWVNVGAWTRLTITAAD
jgi:hypothetical protein